MLSAVILAAGGSTRMGGRPKALLPIGDKTFLEAIVHNLDHDEIGEVFVVFGARHDEVTARAPATRARVLVNDEWEKGQLSSLRTAIRRLSAASEGVLFVPVDHPLVSRSTYRALIDRWARDRSKICVPLHKGQKGHPAIFPRDLYPRILEGELPGGAREVLREQEGRVLLVPVGDPGVIQDIDTVEDFERWIGKWGTASFFP